MRNNIFLTLLALCFSIALCGQNVGIGTTMPNYKLDVNGNSASDNQVSIIPLWQEGNFTMSNTSGNDLSYCESGIIPTVYDASGNIEVQMVVRITST